MTAGCALDTAKVSSFCARLDSRGTSTPTTTPVEPCTSLLTTPTLRTSASRWPCAPQHLLALCLFSGYVVCMPVSWQPNA